MYSLLHLSTSNIPFPTCLLYTRTSFCSISCWDFNYINLNWFYYSAPLPEKTDLNETKKKLGPANITSLLGKSAIHSCSFFPSFESLINPWKFVNNNDGMVFSGTGSIQSDWIRPTWYMRPISYFILFYFYFVYYFIWWSPAKETRKPTWPHCWCSPYVLQLAMRQRSQKRPPSSPHDPMRSWTCLTA